VSDVAWPFVKGHGTGNDFVLLPDPDGRLELTPALVAAICDRRTGLGADGVLRVVRAAKDPDGLPMAASATWFMDYRNADGSVAEMCGNGVRVFVRYLVDEGLELPGAVPVATRAGVRTVTAPAQGDLTVGMGPASFPGIGGLMVRVVGSDRVWPAVAVDVGNPHAVVLVDDLRAPGRLLDAPDVTPASAFPAGVNVEFAASCGSRHLAMRVFERGVGETARCSLWRRPRPVGTRAGPGPSTCPVGSCCCAASPTAGST
jgi:diaminopimelate epimerase